MPGTSAICSGVASSRASIVRKCRVIARALVKPTPWMPRPNSTRENGRSFERSIASARLRAEISANPSCSWSVSASRS